ncbi:hypothetical protein FBU30_011062 [Linnemannia zychae]|nr:hypothetical protein FBU30_011062 [Linnemannia zychae]
MSSIKNTEAEAEAEVEEFEARDYMTDIVIRELKLLDLDYDNEQTMMDIDKKEEYYSARAEQELQNAEQGVVEAQFRVGRMYQYGDGLPQNNEEAMKWYTKAAEMGHLEANFSIGQTYRVGLIGNTKDYFKAQEYYSRAALRGHTESQIQLGCLYQKGYKDFKQDYAMAMVNFMDAAR